MAMEVVERVLVRKRHLGAEAKEKSEAMCRYSRPLLSATSSLSRSAIRSRSIWAASNPSSLTSLLIFSR